MVTSCGSVVMEGAAAAEAGANATPRMVVLVAVVASTVGVAAIVALNAAVSSTFTSCAAVALVVTNRVAVVPVTMPVTPRAPLPLGRNEPRAVQVAPSQEYLRMPPLGLPES